MIRLHCLPDHCLAQLTELFCHQFLHALHEAKLVSDHKIADLLSWKNSGLHIYADTGLVRSSDIEGRQRLAEYLLRAPFSLQKITWNPDTKTVIYRSSRSWDTKTNFQVFTATKFLVAVVEYIPPKGQQTIRYYGLYSNRSRGSARPAHPIVVLPPRTKKPPPENPQAAAIQTLLIPPPPDPPFDIDTFEPIDPPWPAIREWIPADHTDPQAVFPEDIFSPTGSQRKSSSTTIAPWSSTRPEPPVPGLHHESRRNKKSWPGGTNPYCSLIKISTLLACISPLHPPKNAKNLLPRPHSPTHFTPPSPHDPTTRSQRGPPKANSYRT